MSLRNVTVRDAVSGGKKLVRLSVLGTPVIYVECDSKGNSFGYSEVLDFVENRRVLTYSACPNHFCRCQRADCVGEETRAYLSQSVFFLPLVPVIRPSTPLDVSCMDTSERPYNCLQLALVSLTVFNPSSNRHRPERSADVRQVGRRRDVPGCPPERIHNY